MCWEHEHGNRSSSYACLLGSKPNCVQWDLINVFGIAATNNFPLSEFSRQLKGCRIYSTYNQWWYHWWKWWFCLVPQELHSWAYGEQVQTFLVPQGQAVLNHPRWSHGKSAYLHQAQNPGFGWCQRNQLQLHKKQEGLFRITSIIFYNCLIYLFIEL